jgi:hypothetical protein
MSDSEALDVAEMADTAIPVDDLWSERLSSKLRASIPFAQGRTIKGNVMTSLVLIIRSVWWGQARPRLAVVLGESRAVYLQSASPCGPDHSLVLLGLVDAGERLVHEYGLGARSKAAIAITVVHDPALAHSQIRWMNAAGDREIVVLPPEYDAL